MTQKKTYDVNNWTIDRMLEAQASLMPHKVFVTCGKESMTYGESLGAAARVANMLDGAGVGKGDHVAVMLPNGLDFCRAWLGIARLGAVLVAVNTDYKGEFLTHVLNNSDSRALIVSADYLPLIEEIRNELEDLETVYIAGESKDGSELDLRPFAAHTDYAETCDLPRPDYRDTGCIMYTSGTTGPSKGVLMPHVHLYLFGLGTIKHMELTSDDMFYIVLPLFHANGLFMQLYATMIAGAGAVLRERFSASEWIGDVVRYNATITNSLGAVAAFVLNQPPSDLDRAHRLRAMGLAPVSESLVRSLRERFGIPQIFGLYGMTEVNIPLYTPSESSKPSSCGRVWGEFFDLRIVDPETDEELEREEVGEIVVRPRQPYGFMSGYFRMPDETVEAWRNFWFHTGDAARMDRDGDVFFVDRIKDCIRRRGENISSYQVENALVGHDSVKEAAVYAVPSEIEGAEDEVMAAIVTEAGGGTDIGVAGIHAIYGAVVRGAASLPDDGGVAQDTDREGPKTRTAIGRRNPGHCGHREPITQPNDYHHPRRQANQPTEFRL